MAEPRRTLAAQMVVRALLVNPQRETYAGELGRATGLPSGTVIPILHRLEQHGWLTSRREDVDPATAGRPARRYCRLTESGLKECPGFADARKTKPKHTTTED